jgi:hypothetical protein
VTNVLGSSHRPAWPATPAAPPRRAGPERWVVWAILAACGGLVLLSQPYFVGFPSGHHGWVSSHYLAILEHTRRASGLVGYTLGVVDADGTLRNFYWNRYPVLGALVQRELTLGLADGLADTVHLSRQFMNGVFILNIVLSYLVLDRILRRRIVSLAVVLATFSGHFFQFYRDMVFVEQLSILGSLIGIWAIQRFYRDGRLAVLGAAIVPALAIGRGFTLLPILALWAVFAWVSRRQASSPAGGGASCRRASAGVLGLGLLLSGASVYYNASAEARFDDLPLRDTSVLEAAARRGGFDPTFNREHSEGRRWLPFLAQQSGRLRCTLYPVPRSSSRWVPDDLSSESCRGWVCAWATPVILMLGLPFVVADFRSRWDPAQRFAALALLAYGPIWLGLARNLAIWHDYTALYYYGIPLVVYGAIASRLGARGSFALLGLALALFTWSTLEMRGRKTEMARHVNWVTADFQTIADTLRSAPGVIYYEGGWNRLLPGVPFASGFYLPDHPVTEAVERADYVISNRRERRPRSLTPQNRGIFLCPRAVLPARARPAGPAAAGSREGDPPAR